MPQIKITQKRGLSGRPVDQRRTIEALGLHGIGKSVIHDDNPTIRGMANKVSHMVEVEPVSGEEK